MGHCDEARGTQHLTTLTGNVLSNSFLVRIVITWLTPHMKIMNLSLTGLIFRFLENVSNKDVLSFYMQHANMTSIYKLVALPNPKYATIWNSFLRITVTFDFYVQVKITASAMDSRKNILYHHRPRIEIVA